MQWLKQRIRSWLEINIRKIQTENTVAGVSSPLGDWVIFPTLKGTYMGYQFAYTYKTPIQLICTLTKFRDFTFFCTFIL